MISDTKKKLAKYPKRAGAVQFIEDRINPLRTDGGEGYKLELTPGKYGDVGQYTAFVPDSMGVVAEGYVYSKSGNKVIVSGGSGAVGFKVYSTDSLLLTFSNFYSIELSDKAVTNDIYIMAVSANGTEVPVESKNNGNEAQQLEALNEALVSAQGILDFKDSGNKYVGYYYESALETLVSMVEGANAAIENKDQSVHAYGEWASMIDAEISRVIADGDNNRVKIQAGNSYQLYNVYSPQYSMYYESGNVICKSGSSTPKARSFKFVSTGKSNEYYLSTNGKYINVLQLDSRVSATTSKQAEAVKITVGERGFANYYLHKSGDTSSALHCSFEHVLVGWKHDDIKSLWTLRCVDLKKEKADEKSLNELIAEAGELYNLIVDTTSTDATTFYDWVIVSSETLAADVDAMMAKVAVSQSVIDKKYYEKCPALIDELTALIATVKGGYSVPTGINGVVLDEQNAVIYDSRGRRVKSVTQPGIYIVNGKKMYIE